MNFKNFSWAQFSKLRNAINGVGEFRYDTMCSQNSIPSYTVPQKFFWKQRVWNRVHPASWRELGSYLIEEWQNPIQSSFFNLSITSPTSQLILQPFRRFTYVTPHSPTLLLLHLQFILQPFFCVSYITSSSLNSPGEPTMETYFHAEILQNIILALIQTSTKISLSFQNSKIKILHKAEVQTQGLQLYVLVL